MFKNWWNVALNDKVTVTSCGGLQGRVIQVNKDTVVVRLPYNDMEWPKWKITVVQPGLG